MSNNADRDEDRDENDKYPIKDPNCANEYRHLPGGGVEGKNEKTGRVWGIKRVWENYSNK